MKYIAITLSCFVLTCCVGHAQKTEAQLFQIVNKNKIGFIDATGRTVIKPSFRSAGEFSEGLAAVRVDGLYGYVDQTGRFVIEPTFDYGNSFVEGLALVYINGKALFINKNGQKSFEADFQSMGEFEGGLAKVMTPSKKMGFIDKKGRLVIDTNFAIINPFVDGLAVVEGLNHAPYSEDDDAILYETGVIDSTGRWIIPYGKYRNIDDLSNGYFKGALVPNPSDTADKRDYKTALIDKSGKMVLVEKQGGDYSISASVGCGLVRAYLRKSQSPDKQNGKGYNEDTYPGFINLQGEVIINDTTYSYANGFSDNRAFVYVNGWKKQIIIDTKGRKISTFDVTDVIGNGYEHGLAFVKKDGQYGLIDTNAQFLIPPIFDGIDGMGLRDGYFFFSSEQEAKNDDYSTRYGIAQTDGNIVLRPIMEEFDSRGFQGSLLQCIIDGRLAYVNRQGAVVWQEAKRKKTRPENLNVDFMNRGYFYAYSKMDEGKTRGGWAKSPNVPRKVMPNNQFPDRSLQVIVRPETKVEDGRGYNAISVFLVNTLEKNIDFNAQDSRLYMKVQAKDKDGQWKDIEYLPSSWCGNSYHTLTLESRHYWALATPVYKGDFKTMLRIELKYIDPGDTTENTWDKKEIKLYSNEYEGSVNPGQFWRKPGYYPSGLMDPYND